MKSLKRSRKPHKKKKLSLAIAMALSLSHPVVHAQFGPAINLSDLDGSNGIVIAGASRRGFSGFSVSQAGDINGDGLDDLIIGAYRGSSYAGNSYVVFGNNTALPNELNLADIDGVNGFVISGINDDDRSGYSVSQAGDLNDDGIDDLIIGARTASPDGKSEAGSSYVVFGSNVSLPSPLNLSDINGVNGFVINGANADDNLGYSVSVAGDVNNDGIDDVIIGARSTDSNGNSNTGNGYVVYGSSTNLPNPLSVSDLNGVNGFVINGASTSDRAGNSVSHAGDINGDGIDDLIIGAYNADPAGMSSAGSSYVVFGSNTNFPNSFNLSDINGANGFVINGINMADFSGASVSKAGDVNGDGIDDLVIGAHGTDPGGNFSAGSAYVVFGSDTGLPNPFNLSDINGTNGFVINEFTSQSFLGRSVSEAGDINGDGVDDLIVGALDSSPNGVGRAGSSYVVFGSRTPLSNVLLSDLNGRNGFAINGINANDHSGRSVSAAGDINGDGIDDVIVGAYGADPDDKTRAGSSYVVFGSDIIFFDGFEN